MPTNKPLVQSTQQDPGTLDLVLDDIKDYAIFRISLDGKITSWNSGAQRVKGYTRKEAIGMPFARLFLDEDAKSGKPEAAMKKALREGVSQSVEKRRRKDGSAFDAEVTLRRIDGPSGKPVAFVKVTRDVTDRIAAQEDERRRAEFQQTMMGIASHDLRSPLQSILLGTTLLLRSGALSPRQTHTVSQIVSAADRALRLIRDLLDFTQTHLIGRLPMNRRTVEVASMFREVVDELQLAHPSIELNLVSHVRGEARWDPDRIAQLMINLVNNAVRHGDATRGVDLDVRGERDWVTFKVHNEGRPIPAEYMPELFDRPSRGGTKQGATPGSVGLGLYISASIVRAHGGTIAVESTEAKGTTFTVVLPRREGPEQRPAD